MQSPESYLRMPPLGTILQSSFTEFLKQQQQALRPSLWANRPAVYRQLRLPGF